MWFQCGYLYSKGIIMETFEGIVPMTDEEKCELAFKVVKRFVIFAGIKALILVGITQGLRRAFREV